MRKRSMVAVIAIAGIVMATAACSSGTGSSGSSDKSLTYWATNQGTSLANDRQVLTPVLNEFTKETGIKVNLEVIGWNTVQTRIQTAATSGQAPDVTNIGNTWATSFQATGAFLPFASSEMQAIGGSSKFLKTALATGGAAGKAPTSVPLYGLVYTLYYNKKMFADAGLTPPTTYEDMVSDAQKLTNPSAGVHGLALAAGSYTENVHFAFINGSQNGADFFDAKGNPTFTSDAAVDGVLRYLDLMQTDKVVDVADAQYDDSTISAADFAHNKVAMIVSQSDGFGTLAGDKMSPSAYGVVAYPAPAAGPNKIASFIAGINLSIFKNTKNKAGALKFVKFMTSKATQSTLDKAYMSLPVLNGVSPNLPYTVPAGAGDVLENIFSTRSKPLPLFPAEADFETAVGKAMNNLFAKIATGGTVTKADVKTALQTAQDQVTATMG